MEELTPISVGAKSCCMELCTEFCFEILRQVGFFHKLMLSMSEWACILERTLASQLPIFAHLSFEFHLILSDEIIPFLFWIKVLLGLFYCCELQEFIRLAPLFCFSGTLVLNVIIVLKITSLGWGIRTIIEWAFPLTQTLFRLFTRLIVGQEWSSWIFASLVYVYFLIIAADVFYLNLFRNASLFIKVFFALIVHLRLLWVSLFLIVMSFVVDHLLIIELVRWFHHHLSLWL